MTIFRFEKINNFDEVTETANEKLYEDALGEYVPYKIICFGAIVIILYKESAHIEEDSKAIPHFIRDNLLCIGLLKKSKNKLSGIAMGNVIDKMFFPILFFCGIFIGFNWIAGLIAALTVYAAIEFAEHKNENHMLNNLKLLFERQWFQ